MIRTMMHRRQFLVGAGGFALALPTLESLLPRHALAAASPKRFVMFFTMQGGVRANAMYPSESTLDGSQPLYPGHDARFGKLKLDVSGGRASLSRTLTAGSDVLTSARVAKLNLLAGLDIMYYMGHNEGIPNGNFGNNFDLGNKQRQWPEMEASVDQVMAYSPSFYPDIASVRQRSMAIVHRANVDRFSYRWSNGNDMNSGATQVAAESSAKTLFGKIFLPGQPKAEVGRTPVVDRVLEAYKGLRGGTLGDARRLSAYDKSLLDAHMDRLSELQRKLQVAPAPSCGDLKPPATDTNAGSLIQQAQLWNEVVAAGLICGTSRVATIKHGDVFTSGYGGSWHQDIVHQAATNDGAHDWVVKHNQQFFENVFMDLVRRLDVDSGGGRTTLDDSLVVWTMESGPISHDNDSTPAVCAGSAGGFFKTGMFVDYRNVANKQLSSPNFTRAPGLPYNRWLATMLQAMGIPAREWERPGRKGYGSLLNDKPQWYTPAMLTDASTPLPIIT